ncbi:MAG: ATP-binding cassette domain-containing protein [Burkholderiaceae bacterium]
MTADTGLNLAGVGVEKDGRVLLAGIDLVIAEQAFCALIGPSGAGKSTLLRLINRLDDPSVGTLIWRGAPITATPVRELRRRVGFVFQKTAMFPGSVRDNLLAPLQLAGALPADAEPRARVALDRAGLASTVLERAAAELSGGEQQRVAVARALMTRPEVLLLDEPTASLDVESAEHLIATLIDLRESEKLTLVMVSHRLEEARACATQVVMLEAGRIVEAGDSPAFFDSPRQPRTREFLAAAQWGGAK